MTVDFPEVKFPVSKSEQREQDTWELEHGLTSRLKIAQRENPDRNVNLLKKELKEYKVEQPKKERLGLAETLTL